MIDTDLYSTTVFSDSRIAFCPNFHETYSVCINKSDDTVRFAHTCTGHNSCCRYADAEEYKMFLTDIRAVTKYWRKEYFVRSCDGLATTIICDDIDLKTFTFNKYPLNYRRYLVVLDHYFRAK